MKASFKFLAPLSVVFVLLIYGCHLKSNLIFGDPVANDDKHAKRLKIAIVPKGSNNAYWQLVHAGALKAASEYNVDIIWQDPIKEDNVELQRQVMTNFLMRDVNAIVLSPVCQERLISCAQNTLKNKLPLIIIDSELNSQDYTTFVGTDNYNFGKQCARQMTSLLNGKGKVLMMRYSKGHASTMQREEGFMAGLKEYAPEIKIINPELFGGVSISVAQKVAAVNLKENENIDAIFTSCEPATEAMLKALRQSSRQGSIKFVGVDANDLLVDALDAGEIHSLGIQDPATMGYMGVKIAVETAQGKPAPNRISTKVFMVNKSNRNDPAIINLLGLKSKEVAAL